MGFGKYGVLLREVFDIPYERYEKKSWQLKIDVIEGYNGYKNPLHKYVYDQVIYGGVESVVDHRFLALAKLYILKYKKASHKLNKLVKSLVHLIQLK